METLCFRNNRFLTLKKKLSELEDKFDEVNIASAFFNTTELIEKWLNSDKKVKLLISLRPITDYYALRKIMYMDNIEIKFLKSDFHAKLIIILNSNNPVLSVIGSSNFTNGGLETNIETNLVSKNIKITKDIKMIFNSIWEEGYSLENSDMDKYKIVYDRFIEKNMNSETEDLLNELTKERNKNKSKITIKEAKEYRLYWNCVNQIRDIVEDISKEEYPNVSVYLTIDHFWHWIKTIWSKENSPLNKPNEGLIAKMFTEYCKWDKENTNYTHEIKRISDEIFKLYLSEDNIKNLDEDKLKEIYSNLHSGKERAIRFSADEQFVNTNDIEKIKKSLYYLLYSKDDIEIKINNLCDKKGEYKLNEMDTSTVRN